jgi:serine/threonine-protein kinase RsbW
MERHGEPDAAGSAPPPEGADVGVVPGPSGSASDVVTITLPPQPRYIRVARLVAAGLANELGFGLDRLDDVRLAIGEACGLAVQVGAQEVSLEYVLDARSLSVTIDAALGGAGDQLDADYVALVEQVLTVACSDHHVDRDDRRLSIRVMFTDGN